jgi:protein-disulfide isomerase
MRRLLTLAFAPLIAAAVAMPAHAQFSQPGTTPTNFKDTSMIRPPAGSKVAIWEFEDLECPACAHAAPIVRGAVAKYKIPYVHHDFPLPMHIWSFDAAIDARYIQDKLNNPQLAEQYRLAVFAAQNGISNKDDLHNFTTHFASAHGIQWPFVIDPQGTLTAKVNADKALGDRIGLVETPTIWVVTNHGMVQVRDITQLYTTIDSAIAYTSAKR